MIKNKIFVNGRENYLFLIFILALFFNDSIAYSQTQSPSQRANYNLPLTLHFSQNFFLNDGPEYERITGGYELMGGIQTRARFSDKIFLRTGVYFSYRETAYSRAIHSAYISSINGAPNDIVYFDKYKLKMFQIPLFLQYNFFENSKIMCYTVGGFVANIRLQEIFNGKTEQGIAHEQSFSYNPLDDKATIPVYTYAPYQVGLGLGVVYKLNNNRMSFGIEPMINWQIQRSTTSPFDNTNKKHFILNAGITMTYLLNKN